jgi:IS5 family transposase
VALCPVGQAGHQPDRAPGPAGRIGSRRRKVVSIFEAHTDIIIKDKRDTYYGHKICLTSGKSGLFLDCVIEDGNPADSTLAVEMVGRQKTIYGRQPRQAAYDGGFASRANLSDLKSSGVQDVMFSKKRGLQVVDMAKNSYVYKKPRDFRAGIEAMISFLKRSLGAGRCTWRGGQWSRIDEGSQLIGQRGGSVCLIRTKTGGRGGRRHIYGVASAWYGRGKEARATVRRWRL